MTSSAQVHLTTVGRHRLSSRIVYRRPHVPATLFGASRCHDSVAVSIDYSDGDQLKGRGREGLLE